MHFTSAAEFGKAMELLYQYEKLVAQKVDWREMEKSMLEFLEDGEANLLDRAQRYVAERARQQRTTTSPVEIQTAPTSPHPRTTVSQPDVTLTELVDRFITHKRQSTKLSTVKSFAEKCRRLDRILTLLSKGQVRLDNGHRRHQRAERDVFTVVPTKSWRMQSRPLLKIAGGGHKG